MGSCRKCRARLALVLVVAVLAFALEGIVLTPEHAVVTSPFRRRRIPWRDVQGVVLDDEDIVIGLSDGRCLTVLYPQRFTRGGPPPQDEREADWERIWRWWVDHRGADWRPVTQPARPGAPPVVGTPTVDDAWSAPPEGRW